MDKVHPKNISHVAIIMDGNGRWAKNKNLDRSKGHKKGLDNIIPIVQELIDWKIKHITLFAFSTENNNRPYDEKKHLVSLLENALNKIAKKTDENNINLSFIGDLKHPPKKIISKIEKLNEINKHDASNKLIIAWNYSGRTDILEAINKINDKNITEEKFSNLLMTKNIPDPDLIIRTGNQIRLSNFMLWQSAYSELYFSTKLWPDFNTKDLNDALNQFMERKRNYGAV